MKTENEKRTRVNRRDFIRSNALLAAGAALPGWFVGQSANRASAAEANSPNDRPRIALIGSGGRGRSIARNARSFGDIVAVCDVDDRHIEQAQSEFEGAKGYKDFRKLIDRENVDIVLNGTPDHWHTLINIHAMRARKDVYSEKPLTLTIDEGKHVVEAARETGRVFQTGSQQRSDRRFRLACELVRNGRLGRLTHITTFLPPGPKGGPFEPSTPPEALDWDFWLGSTPKVPYIEERCHGSFRYWYQFSGGTMTDWGAHHNDIAQWANGTERSGPVAIEGRPLEEPIPGGYTAHGHYVVEYEYANGVRLTCRSVGPEGGHGSQHGAQFVGTEGWIFVTRGKITASNPELLEEPLPESAERLYKSDHHMGNFFECVRSRKDPICDAEIGHRSASVCHLGVISIRLGRRLKWDPESEQFVDDAEANAMVARSMRAPWSYEAI